MSPLFEQIDASLPYRDNYSLFVTENNIIQFRIHIISQFLMVFLEIPHKSLRCLDIQDA